MFGPLGAHVFWELFRNMTGLTNSWHVPYLVLFAAQVQAYFGYMAPLIEFIRGGSYVHWR